MTKDIQEKILSHLIHYPKSSFTDLYDSSIDIPSNEFTYHLNKLIEDGFIEKDETKKYSLTIKGKHLESELDGKTGKQRKKPFLALLLVVRRDGEYLLYHRLKEPFYDFYGLPGAKIDFFEKILDAAKRELLEETGLCGDGQIIAISNVRTKENETPLSHFAQFVVLFDNPEGKLIENSIEGEYRFAPISEFVKKNKENKLFPDIMLIIEKADKFKGEISILEMDITNNPTKFLDFKVEEIH